MSPKPPCRAGAGSARHGPGRSAGRERPAGKAPAARAARGDRRERDGGRDPAAARDPEAARHRDPRRERDARPRGDAPPRRPNRPRGHPADRLGEAPAPDADPEDAAWQVEGRHPVREALQAGRPIHRILLERGTGGPAIAAIRGAARAAGVPVVELGKDAFARLSRTGRAQGVIALAAARPYVELDDLLLAVAKSGRPALLFCLDQLSDPQNLGTILRVADGCGAHGVVIPKRRSAGLGPGAARASAGAVEHVPVARVPNLVRAIETLKAAGIWAVGADAAGDREYTDVDWTQPTALVIGSEGGGLARLVRETCDVLVKIPMAGRLASLNAATAAAVLGFEAARQRRSRG